MGHKLRSLEFVIPKLLSSDLQSGIIYLMMGFAYVGKDQQGVHFVTLTVHQWVDARLPERAGLYQAMLRGRIDK